MRRSHTYLTAGYVVLIVGMPGESAKASESDLAAQAQTILQAHCVRCHGTEGKAKGGFNYVLNRDRLVASAKLVPGKAEQSELFQRILKNEMPPKESALRPSTAEIALLKRWIDNGAPTAGPRAPRAFLTEDAVLRLMLADVETLEPRQRRFIRYVTLYHLANANIAEADLQVGRQAVAKLINSLSWHPRITPPHPIDPAWTILRLDLRAYKWNARSWDRLVFVYPYRVPNPSAEAKALAAATGSELPFLRADWLVATASRPPLYHDLLQLPSTDRELERQLRIEAQADIQEESVVRSGFNDSGVSKNNRLIERHDSVYGAYWRSYDFAENVGRQNLFEHPLGPTVGANSFEHAGGEVIFHLPNGLQAYLLLDRAGRRLDRAPIDIVSDPKRPDRIVENGLSCMSCHERGLIFKADQVRAHVEKNPTAFSKAEIEQIKALYPAESMLRALLDEDNERYGKALVKTGAHTASSDPITSATLRYEGTLDLTTAAAEIGLQPDEFVKRLDQAPLLARVLGALRSKGGSIQRDVFVASFPDLVREFRLGQGPTTADASIPAFRPFAGHTGAINSIALTSDGRFALSASDDKTLRWWEIASGKEIRRFQGHIDAVLAVVLSPDGRLALSGGADRTVRLWEVNSGRELRRFTGHTDKVRCVAFTPDGRIALSGGDDRTIRLWDGASGKELRVLTGHSQTVSSLAVSSDNCRVLSGSYDQTLRLWDLASGKEISQFGGHAREVYAVAFSPDDRQVLSGGNDRTIHLWDIASGMEIRRFEGHANAVIRVAFTADGRHILSGSSQYRRPDRFLRLWEIETGRAVRGLGGSEADRVSCLAFSPDDRFALTGQPEEFTLRLWKITD